MNTSGAFTYSDVMGMELAEFKDVILEIAIMNSQTNMENFRRDNHANAQRGR